MHRFVSHVAMFFWPLAHAIQRIPDIFVHLSVREKSHNTWVADLQAKQQIWGAVSYSRQTEMRLLASQLGVLLTCL